MANESTCPHCGRHVHGTGDERSGRSVGGTVLGLAGGAVAIAAASLPPMTVALGSLAVAVPWTPWYPVPVIGAAGLFAAAWSAGAWSPLKRAILVAAALSALVLAATGAFLATTQDGGTTLELLATSLPVTGFSAGSGIWALALGGVLMLAGAVVSLPMGAFLPARARVAG